MVLLVFRSPELHEMLGARYDAKAFYNALSPDLDGYWLFLGRVDLGTEWFFHAPVPADTTADNFDFAAYLHRAVGERFPLDITYIGFWDLRIAIADSYRKGRALIAGYKVPRSVEIRAESLPLSGAGKVPAQALGACGKGSFFSKSSF